ncbi:hypothetical protein V6N11_001457 [Hibiscus sabdariffa]|uniref:Uncharacterized protein n=1 Tax=Hibiscus sabdariffa TaxID=183260 RepID=A0ABR2RZS7_9ROSI
MNKRTEEKQLVNGTMVGERPSLQNQKFPARALNNNLSAKGRLVWNQIHDIIGWWDLSFPREMDFQFQTRFRYVKLEM